MKIKVGIFFGGPSSERELSFTGGRAVYDYLNRTIYEPVPIFVDSNKQLTILDAKNLYSKSIRDFYPPADEAPATPNGFRVYLESLGELSTGELLEIRGKIGRPILPEDLKQEINLALLTLGGTYGADGELQILLDSLDIPYTGSGPGACETGMDKVRQSRLLQDKGFQVPASLVISRQEWLRGGTAAIFEKIKTSVGLPARILPARQTAAGGWLKLDNESTARAFVTQINRAFSRTILSSGEWLSKSTADQLAYIEWLTTVDTGFGFPLEVIVENEKATLYHPEQLLAYLHQKCRQNAECAFVIEGATPAESVVVEAIPGGRPFSCTVVQDENGAAVALPPCTWQAAARTGPVLEAMALPEEQASALRANCEQLFHGLELEVYARIDGYINGGGAFIFSDVQVAPDWHPTAFAYQQAAQLGLSPSQWMSFFIRISLLNQIRQHPHHLAYQALLELLDEQITAWHTRPGKRKKIGVLLGGYSEGNALSVAGGRHVFNLLSQSAQYVPIPFFLSGKENIHELYPLPLPLLLRETAGDIRAGLTRWKPASAELQGYTTLFSPFSPDQSLSASTKALTYDDLKKQVDAVFIALQERPAKDGQVQMQLDARKIPYNGAGAKTTSLAFDRQRTLQKLKLHGFIVPEPFLSANGNLSQSEVIAGAYHFLKIKGALLTYLRRDGSIAYDVFQPAEKSAHNDHWSAPAHFDKRGGSDQAYIEGQVIADLEKAAQVLQLEGYSSIEAYVRVFPSGKADTLITEIDPLPLLQPDSTIFQQAALRDYHPQDLVVNVMNFALAKMPQPVLSETNKSNAGSSLPPPVMEAEEITYFAPEKRQETTTTDIYMEENSQEEAYHADYLTESSYDEVAVQDDAHRPQEDRTILLTVKEWLKAGGRSVWAFLKSPAFLKNFVALLGFFIVLFILLVLWLRGYTNHGESLQVHNYIGMSLQEAEQKAESRSFSVVVIDSFFDPDEIPYRIYNQDPKPLSRVKEDRTIYLSVYSRTPKKKRLPTLIGNYDYSQYAKKLKHLKIKTKIKEQVFDSRLEPNTIMYLVFEGEKITDNDLRQGVDIPEGSLVEFVVSKSQTDVVPIPDVVCDTYQEAIFLISSLNLSIGQVYGEVFDREQAYVWKQEPEYTPGEMIRVGQQVNIYLTESKPSECYEEGEE